jgi:hypothetical protein
MAISIRRTRDFDTIEAGRPDANFTAAYLTRFGTPHCGSSPGWRASGTSTRIRDWLTVITSRYTPSGTTNQRVDQTMGNVRRQDAEQPSNPSAFAYPAAGALGSEPNRSIQGPGFWNVDAALAKVLAVAGTRTIEFRVEAFNLFNNFNWGNPTTNLDSSTFGKITSQLGDPRIMQFAVKYGF